ncbi:MULTISPECIES: hypothetical protein [Nocardiaceae]|uniref:hypothetical protein n=1 Tax=Nocardiaceae TaxID=85025 RepID=UPI00050C4DAA|nr:MULTISPECIES: hypothetical protein [Rhodococcus]MBJ7324266.1 hypothetical protein [Rhodococcus sp. (in: high G+C Gram-positive bacteria)]WQH28017.1 hypothetical protein U2G91_23690 [Rhodococcus fascians]
MKPVVRRARRGTAPATGLLIALTVLGVLLMHSVTPTPSMSMSMSMPMTAPMSTPMTPATSAGHPPMASTHPLDDSIDDSVPVMAAEHGCPPTHQMMHPCVGTTVSWPALSIPAINAEIDLSAASIKPNLGRTDSILERAPPWTLWELDRSVTLRV